MKLLPAIAAGSTDKAGRKNSSDFPDMPGMGKLRR